MNLFSLKGKADLLEWWTVSLLSDLLAQLAILGAVLSLVSDEWWRWIAFVLLAAAGLVMVWFSIAVTVRRLSDRGRPALSIFAGLVPVVGWIWLLVECGFLPSRRVGPKKVLVKRVVENGDPV